ncbi:MAG: lipopolysaccharide biosynthesis protein [Oscillospiraceae bacterium]
MNKIIEKYHSLSNPVKASLWFTMCSILQKGIQFLTVPVMTRIMTSEQYGEYSVFLSWYQIIMIFATLNMWNYVLSNGMIKYENDRDGYLSSLQGLSTLITVVLFAVYVVFSGIWEKTTSLSFPAMAIMFIELLLMPSFEYWCARKRFEYSYKGVVILSLAIAVLVPTVSIPLIILTEEKGMAAIIGRTITSAVVYAIPFVIIAVKGKKFYSKEYWSFALKFNLPLIPHFLSLIVLQQSDRIMISSICGDDKAGIYSVAYSAAVILQIVNTAVLSSFIPYTYNSIKEQKYSGICRNANFLLILIAFMNLLLICVAPEAIRILGPEEYYEAAYIIPPVAISGTFMFMFNLFANIEYYFEETKFVAAASIFSAAANVVLNAIFIPIFGYHAAGYTTLACYILFSLAHYIFMRIVLKKHLSGRKIYNGKLLVLIVSASVALSMLLQLAYPYPVVRYGILIIAIVICVIKRNTIINNLKMIKEKKTS